HAAPAASAAPAGSAAPADGAAPAGSAAPAASALAAPPTMGIPFVGAPLPGGFGGTAGTGGTGAFGGTAGAGGTGTLGGTGSAGGTTFGGAGSAGGTGFGGPTAAGGTSGTGGGSTGTGGTGGTGTGGDVGVLGGGGGTVGGGSTAGGGTGDGGTGAEIRPTIDARILLPMSDTVSIEAFWSAVSPLLRSGDLVVAKITRDDATMTMLSWSERARADAPLAGYAAAFDRPAQLEAALSRGLPAALDTVGLARTDGVDDATLTRVATKVHAAGRRLFVSVTVPSRGPTLGAVATRAEIVELVVPGASPDATASGARNAVATLGPKPTVFIRLPDGLSTATATANASKVVVGTVPTAGVAMPWSDRLPTLMTEVRPK
ncbi:MAG: hypothetical protein HYV09_41715, partial [Deltaproteobacteria bacterium]|nr:hypothetical protein [Deltaproteobacteria bacterium]